MIAAAGRPAVGMLLACWIVLLPALSVAAAAAHATSDSARRTAHLPVQQTAQQTIQQTGHHSGPEALLAHLAEVEALEGTFRQTRHIAVLAMPLHSAGTFRYQREQGIVWRTEEPISSEIRITHDQEIVAVDEHGGSRALPASDVVAGIFLSLFAGELDRLREYFAVEVMAADAIDGESVELATLPGSAHLRWALRLTPSMPALASQIEYILVAGADHVDSVAIQDANGDRSELTLSLIQPGAPAQP